MKLKLISIFLTVLCMGTIKAVSVQNAVVGVTLAYKKATLHGTCIEKLFVKQLATLFKADFRPLNDIDDKQYYEHLKMRGVVGFVYIDGTIPYVVFKDGHMEKAGKIWGNLVVASNYNAYNYKVREA